MVTISHSYFFFVILFCISSFLFQKSTYAENGATIKKINAYNIIGIVLLTVIASLYIGQLYSDIYNYEYVFYKNEHLGYTEVIKNSGDNVLFYLIGKIIYHFGGKFLTFFLFDFIIVISGYCYVKDKNKDYSLFIGALVFCISIYYPASYNILKQGVAIAIILFAIRYVYENKLSKFIIAVLIASSLHGTAIIAIVMWLFWDHKNKKPISLNKSFVLISIAAVVILGYNGVLSYLSGRFNLFSEYTQYSSQVEATNRDFYVNLLLLAVVLVFSGKLIKLDNRNQMLICFFIISIFTSYLGFYNPFVKRIGTYFLAPAKIMLLGYLPSTLIGKSRVLARIIVVICILVVFYLSHGDNKILQFGIIQRSF